MCSCVCESPSKSGNFLKGFIYFKDFILIQISNTVLCSHLGVSVGDELFNDRLPPVLQENHHPGLTVFLSHLILLLIVNVKHCLRTKKKLHKFHCCTL